LHVVSAHDGAVLFCRKETEHPAGLWFAHQVSTLRYWLLLE
jgi:hypothetical protein